MNNFETSFKTFLAGAQAKYEKTMKASFSNLNRDEFTVKEGKRYIKILAGTSVNIFVDKTTGDVLKPASWRAPAKHARGNIFNSDNGLNCISDYGTVAYLR